MPGTGGALRRTSDSLLRDLEALLELEEEKRTIDPGDPRLVDLAAQIEQVAKRVLASSTSQRAQTQLIHELTETGSSAIMLALVIVTMIAGRLLAIPADDLFGVVSGVTGNPAILVYASRAGPTARPAIGFALVFPTVAVAHMQLAEIAATGRGPGRQAGDCGAP